MDTVHVKEVTRRYRLCQSTLQLKPKLNELSENLLRKYLDLALQDTGQRPSDILCIKTLNFPLSFRTGKTDQEHYQLWLRSLVKGIESVLESPQGDAWLRFPSIVAALNSALVQLSLHDSSRVWAWKQIGFVQVSSQSIQSYLNDCWAYLCHSPEFISPILSSLYQRRLLCHFISSDALGVTAPFASLIDSKLQVDDLSIDWLALQQAIATLLQGQKNDTAASLTRRLFVNEPQSNQLKHNYSPYFLSLCTALFKMHEVRSYQLAEPTLQLELVKGLCLLMQIPASGNGMFLYRTLEDIARQITDLVLEVGVCLSRVDVDKDSNALGIDDDTALDDSFVSQLLGNKTLEGDLALIESDLSLINALKGSIEQNQIKCRHSEFGGLMFVHNFLKQASWQAMLVEKFSLPYSPSLILNHLALGLLPEAEDDPIIDIFSGTSSDMSHIDTDTGETENRDLPKELQEDIECLAKELKRAISEQVYLQKTGQRNTHNNLHRNADQADDDATFIQMCQRKARIESEEGWLNLFFDMESVDTSLRALGLDLDLKYAPYLPYTVRFYYE